MVQTVKHLFSSTRISRTDSLVTSTNSDVTFTTTRDVTKANLPGDYRRIIAENGNATTRLSGVDVSLSKSPSNGQFRSVKKFPGASPPITTEYTVQGDIFPVGPPSGLGSSVTKALNQAKSEWVSKARRHQGTFQTGVFIGELRDTVKLIGSSTKSIARHLNNYLTDAKRIRGSGRKRSRKQAIADKWLEYSFGVKPLINDILDAAEQAGRMAFHPPSVMVRSRGRSQSSGNYTLGSGSLGPLSWSYDRTDIETVEAKIYGKVSVQMTDGVPTLAGKLRLSLDDFIPTVWELIPYSFLVDYFVNVDDMLSALSFNRANTHWISYGTKIECHREVANVKMNPVPPNASLIYDSHYLNPGTVHWILKRVERYPSLPTLVPSIQFSFPTSAAKIANMAALLFSKHKDLIPFPMGDGSPSRPSGRRR